MDNQKSNDGNARDMGREGSGSSMGKDLGPNRGPGNSGATGSGSVIDKAAEAAQPVVDRLASSAHAGVDKVSGALAGASKSMDEKTRQLTDAARNFADTGRGYVRSSPVTSILVAVGAGYILSKILGRRH